MATIIEQMVQQIQTLTDEEQRQIRALLDAPSPTPAGATPEQQRRLAERLLADGLLDHIPQDAYTEAARDRHDPVPVIGRPLSETLLEDRE